MAVLRASQPVAAGAAAGPGFDALPTPMAVVDGELCIAEARAALAELLGVPAASRMGEPLGHRLRSAATEAPDGEGVQTFQFQRQDGPCWLRLDLEPLDGQPLALLVDVSGERTVLDRMKADIAAR